MKNNKEIFVMPVAEVVLFDTSDVITASGMFGFFGEDDNLEF